MSKTPRKPGRPPLPKREKKQHKIMLRLSAVEYREAKRSARAWGMPLAAWVRKLVNDSTKD